AKAVLHVPASTPHPSPTPIASAVSCIAYPASRRHPGMSDGKRRSGGSDLISGIVAAVGVLLMVVLLRFPVWLGVLLASGLCGGTWLATRAALPAAQPRLDEEALLRHIAGLYRSVPNPRVQARIGEITQQARAFLAFLNEHPDRAAAWR